MLSLKIGVQAWGLSSGWSIGMRDSNYKMFNLLRSFVTTIYGNTAFSKQIVPAFNHPKPPFPTPKREKIRETNHVVTSHSRYIICFCKLLARNSLGNKGRIFWIERRAVQRHIGNCQVGIEPFRRGHVCGRFLFRSARWKSIWIFCKSGFSCNFQVCIKREPKL